MILLAEVQRKKGESFEAMMRRFTRSIQQSGKLLQAKKIRFRLPTKTKRKVRENALHRSRVQEKNDYLIRSGKLKEEDVYKRRRFRR